MLQLLLKTTKYQFIQGNGTDWIEGHQSTMNKALGKGVLEFSNKRGGIMDVIFLGELSTTKKAAVINQIEEECGIEFVGQGDAFFLPEYEQILNRMHDNKVIVKK